MIQRLLERFVTTLGVLWAVLTGTFLIAFALPGDPARAVAGPQARPADVARLRKDLGLGKPLPIRYARFCKRFIHIGPKEVASPKKGGHRSKKRKQPKGPKAHRTCSKYGRLHFDLGRSYQRRQPVLKLIGKKLPASLLLAAASVLIQVALSLTLGSAAAAHRDRSIDRGVLAFAILLMSVPTFLSGILLQYVVAYRLRLLPLDGYGATSLARVVHVLLPALTIGMVGAAYSTRLVRDEVTQRLGANFVRTARAKGLSPMRVMFAHVLRAAAMPLVTSFAMDLGALVGGAIVTEKIFRWPGLGRLAVEAVFQQDAPVIMGTVLVSACGVVIASAAIDALGPLLDPRISDTSVDGLNEHHCSPLPRERS